MSVEPSDPNITEADVNDSNARIIDTETYRGRGVEMQKIQVQEFRK
jgi:hypothetical protein